MKAQYKRGLFSTILKRMREPRRFLQVLAGPRQVGKTTLARQVARELDIPVHYASADEPTLQDRAWLNQQWDIARSLTRREPRVHPALLIEAFPVKRQLLVGAQGIPLEEFLTHPAAYWLE